MPRKEPHLVMVGGGHSHALVLRDYAGKNRPRAQLTLIDPARQASYSGMVPGVLAGHYPRELAQIDLAQLAERAGATLLQARMLALDMDRRSLRLSSGDEIPFDLLSLDIGADLRLDLPGARHATPAKPLTPLIDRWDRFLADRAAGVCPPNLCVIGAGLAGFELALAAAWRLRSDPARPEVLLVDRSKAFAGLGRRAERMLRKAIHRAGVILLEETVVAGLGSNSVTLADGVSHPAGMVITAAGARAPQALIGSGLPLVEGFVSVTPQLHIPGDPTIFATGDCAHLAHAPRPKAGVFAVRQAPILAHNLIAATTGDSLRRHDPQGDYLRLVSCGDRRAIAIYHGLSLRGRWPWWLKDRIDRSFVDSFRR
ncbi:FAD-dependent oxidoreductase [Plastorhodobacter daqingensis]|uniref:FAD-dependent oxidoreductase n=1 Tax=Plastorhodobacter daqingensis TaxID=1387281 RepID=A0ABW2UM52_9RHOB